MSAMLANQLDNKTFDDQMKVEKEQQAEAGREYAELLEAARQGQGHLTDAVLKLIHSPEDPLNDTTDNIKTLIDYVAGPQERWSSGGTETVEFRRLVKETFDKEWEAFARSNPGISIGNAMQKLPSTFLLDPLPPTQFDALSRSHPASNNPGAGALKAMIHYVDQDNLECSTYREFRFNLSAAQALEATVGRIKSVLQVEQASHMEFMFRVLDRAEYIYGDQQLINFRYIRDCIVKNIEIHLQVLPLPFDSNVLTAPRFDPRYPSADHHVPTHLELETAFNNSVLEGRPEICSNISTWSVPTQLEVDVSEISNISLTLERCKAEKLRDGDDVYVCVVAELVFGTQALCAPMRTSWKLCRGLVGSREIPAKVIWGEDAKITFPGPPIASLPRETKLCLSLVGVTGDSISSGVAEMTATQLLDETILTSKRLKRFKSMMGLGSEEDQQVPIFYLSTANVQLFDYRGTMRSGWTNVRMWTSDQKCNPIGTSSLNPNLGAVGCRLHFPEFAMPLVHPSGAPPEDMIHAMQVSHHDRLLRLDIQLRNNKIAQLRLIKRVLTQDPLYVITATEKILLWQYRNDLIKRPRALAKFLQSVDWTEPAAVHDAHLLLHRWAPLQPLDALELLDARFADEHVRRYAIACIDRMADNELKGCLLQLVQVLKYEPFHYSALCRFLLKRSLRTPHLIGHSVFWQLKAEMQNPMVCERHGLLIEEFLQKLPSRRDFLRQFYVTDQLLAAAMAVKECTKKSERPKVLNTELRKVKFPARFTLPLNPTMECTGLIFRDCKVMSSKKLPLWLVFHNAYDPTSPIFVMFKAGDDLRQDLLTLQMLELMDNVWKASGLNLHLIPYGCVATGEGVGMIEIVLHADTVANITRKDGGAQAAFSDEPLMNWLRKYNRTDPDVERCLWNFVYSTAGSCVATYVLGIGDRHNDNIMLRQDGTLFHIDFGHFLGNYKTKFGIKRETAPFIFTNMYAYMMGGPQSPIYAHFVEIACHAYNVIRRHHNMLIVLFLLMLSTGIPELQRVEDIMWLKSVLRTDDSDDEATAHYKTMIQDALDDRRTLINDCIHIMVHT